MDTADCSTVEDIEQAEARRRRVFRWMLRGAVLFVVLLVAIRLLWGWEAERRLQAEIDRCHAAGEPILVSDFPDPAPIADEDNAAYWYRRAEAAIKPTDNKVLDFWQTLDYSRGLVKDYPHEFMRSIAPNEDALELIRKGRRCSRGDWGFRYRSPLLGWSTTPIGTLSKLTLTAAGVYYYSGDQAEAIELLIDAEVLARSFGRDSLVGFYWVVLSPMWRDADWVEELAPSLVAEDAKFAENPTDHRPSRQQVRHLIQLLLDDKPLGSSWRRAIHSTRAEAVDTAQQCIEGWFGLPPMDDNTLTLTKGALLPKSW